MPYRAAFPYPSGVSGILDHPPSRMMTVGFALVRVGHWTPDRSAWFLGGLNPDCTPGL